MLIYINQINYKNIYVLFFTLYFCLLQSGNILIFLSKRFNITEKYSNQGNMYKYKFLGNCEIYYFEKLVVQYRQNHKQGALEPPVLGEVFSSLAPMRVTSSEDRKSVV